MTRPYPYRKPERAPKTASPLLRELFFAMEEEQITLSALARKLRTTRQMVYAWKNGKNYPSGQHLEDFAHAVNRKLILEKL